MGGWNGAVKCEDANYLNNCYQTSLHIAIVHHAHAQRSTFSWNTFPRKDSLSTELELVFVSDRQLTLLSLSSAVRGTLTSTVPAPSAEANNGDDDSLDEPAGWPVSKGEQQNDAHTKTLFSVLKAS